MSTIPVIMESPDGGKTFRTRPFNVLEYQQPKYHGISIEEFIQITEMAKTNLALQKALDSVILIYQLSKST